MSTRSQRARVHEQFSRQSSSLPLSIQTVLNDCQSSVSADQLQILASLTPNTRCEALRMRFSGVAGDSVVHHLCSGGPSCSVSADPMKKSFSFICCNDNKSRAASLTVAATRRSAPRPLAANAVSRAPGVTERQLILSEEDEDERGEVDESISPAFISGVGHARPRHLSMHVRSGRVVRENGVVATSASSTVARVHTSNHPTHTRTTPRDSVKRLSRTRTTAPSRADSMSLRAVSAATVAAMNHTSRVAGRTNADAIPCRGNSDLGKENIMPVPSVLAERGVPAASRFGADARMAAAAAGSSSLSLSSCSPVHTPARAMSEQESYSLYSSPSPVRVHGVGCRGGLAGRDFNNPYTSTIGDKKDCVVSEYHTPSKYNHVGRRRDSAPASCSLSQENKSCISVLVALHSSPAQTSPCAPVPRTPSLGTLVSVSPSSRGSSVMCAAEDVHDSTENTHSVGSSATLCQRGTEHRCEADSAVAVAAAATQAVGAANVENSAVGDGMMAAASPSPWLLAEGRCGCDAAGYPQAHSYTTTSSGRSGSDGVCGELAHSYVHCNSMDATGSSHRARENTCIDGTIHDGAGDTDCFVMQRQNAAKSRAPSPRDVHVTAHANSAGSTRKLGVLPCTHDPRRPPRRRAPALSLMVAAQPTSAWAAETRWNSSGLRCGNASPTRWRKAGSGASEEGGRAHCDGSNRVRGDTRTKNTCHDVAMHINPSRSRNSLLHTKGDMAVSHNKLDSMEHDIPIHTEQDVRANNTVRDSHGNGMNRGVVARRPECAITMRQLYTAAKEVHAPLSSLSVFARLTSAPTFSASTRTACTLRGRSDAHGGNNTNEHGCCYNPNNNNNNNTNVGESGNCKIASKSCHSGSASGDADAGGRYPCRSSHRRGFVRSSSLPDNGAHLDARVRTHHVAVVGRKTAPSVAAVTTPHARRRGDEVREDDAAARVVRRSSTTSMSAVMRATRPSRVPSQSHPQQQEQLQVRRQKQRPSMHSLVEGQNTATTCSARGEHRSTRLHNSVAVSQTAAAPAQSLTRSRSLLVCRTAMMRESTRVPERVNRTWTNIPSACTRHPAPSRSFGKTDDSVGAVAALLGGGAQRFLRTYTQ